MTHRGLTDENMRYVQTIIRAALDLIAAFERERSRDAKGSRTGGTSET
jgi:hypothetical protein